MKRPRATTLLIVALIAASIALVVNDARGQNLLALLPAAVAVVVYFFRREP